VKGPARRHAAWAGRATSHADHIKEAAIKASTPTDTKYPGCAGTPALRQGDLAKMKRDHGLEYTAVADLVTSGGSRSSFNAMLATRRSTPRRGDHPALYWVSDPRDGAVRRRHAA